MYDICIVDKTTPDDTTFTRYCPGCGFGFQINQNYSINVKHIQGSPSSGLEMSYIELKGKIVVITGATTGIGEASAIEFSKYGARLVLCGRNLEGLIDTKQKCMKQGLTETDVTIVTGDIRKDETLDLIAETSVNTFGGVDVLFLNAGKSHPKVGPVTKPDSIEALDDYYELQIKSQYKLTQKLSAELIKSKGAIVITTVMADFIDPGFTPALIMKAAQDQMVRLFALTFANKGVCVNAVGPGAVATNTLSEVLPDSSLTAAFMSKFAAMTPLGSSLATPEEIGRVVVFLASSQSACMTGTLLSVDKGFTMTHPAVDWKQF